MYEWDHTGRARAMVEIDEARRRDDRARADWHAHASVLDGEVRRQSAAQERIAIALEKLAGIERLTNDVPGFPEKFASFVTENVELAKMVGASARKLLNLPPARLIKIAWARHNRLYALGTDNVLRLHYYGRWEVIHTPCEDDGTPCPVADFAVHESGSEIDGFEISLAVLLQDGRLFESVKFGTEWRGINLPDRQNPQATAWRAR